VRQHKLDAELRTARKDRDFYLSRVDKAKALDAMEERNKGKRAKEAEGGEGDEGGGAAEGERKRKVRRDPSSHRGMIKNPLMHVTYYYVCVSEEALVCVPITASAWSRHVYLRQ
jgi:hypothetical protein